jgi:hypothetical protein
MILVIVITVLLWGIEKFLATTHGARPISFDECFIATG